MHHASNLTGNVNDLETIGRICKKHGILFLLDASQTAGVFDIDMGEWELMLSALRAQGIVRSSGNRRDLRRGRLDITAAVCRGSGVQSFLRTQPSRCRSGWKQVH